MRPTDLIPPAWRFGLLAVLVLLVVAVLVGLGWSGRSVVADRDQARAEAAAHHQQVTQLQHHQAVAHQVAAAVDRKQEILHDNAVRVAAAVGAYRARHSRPAVASQPLAPVGPPGPDRDADPGDRGAADLALDAEWVQHHDAAVPDLVAAPAGPDAPAGPVGAAEALDTVTRNYAVCADAIMRLEELQQLLLAQ